jgi:hypothetical protein
MPASFASSASKILAFVPFGYLFTTRIHGLRDLFYLLATNYVPAALLVALFGTGSPADLLAQLALGLTAFICIYELGYYSNDVWDSKRDPIGRQRSPIAGSIPVIVAFAGIRVGVWLAISAAAGWLGSAIWLSSCAALLVVFSAHNIVSANSARAATFAQLACFRIVVPIVAVVPKAALPEILCLSMIGYMHLRHLSYLDGKGFLKMPDRKSRWFALSQAALFLPLAAAISAWTQSPNALLFQLYFVLVYVLAFFGEAHLKRATASESPPQRGT